MRNQTEFTNFVSSGWFSGGAAPSIPDDRELLLDGFKSLIVSKALAANGYAFHQFPTISNDVCQPEDCSPIASEGTASCWYLDCAAPDPLDELPNICRTAQQPYDIRNSYVASNNTYFLTLLHKKSPEDANSEWEVATSQMNAMVSNQWIHLQSFLLSASRCNTYAAPKPVGIQFSKDNVLDTACLNGLPEVITTNLNYNSDLVYEALCPARLQGDASSDEQGD